MGININLELSLSSSSSPDSDNSHMMEEEYESKGKSQQPPQPKPQPQPQPQQQQQKLTIFYDGKMWVCDVTEIQAAAILMLAKKETEEKVRSRSSESKQSSAILESNDEMSRASTGLMMKRSLQRFLQKRKNRIQEACPYYH